MPQKGQDHIRSLVQSYSECFSLSSKVGKTPIAKHRIVTDEYARPLLQSTYRVSPPERQAIREQVNEMLHDDFIQPSKSPWAGAVLLVKKTEV